MARNRKLTRLIAGRTVTGLTAEASRAVLSFDDGSAMTVLLGAPAPPAPALGRIRAVRQSDTTLQLDFDGLPTVVLTTAEATASVMLRDRNHLLEYAD